MAKYQKGESGNPAGRPKGLINQASLRASIEKDIPEILAAMTAQAKAGDTQAARLLLDRTLPSIKPTDQPVSLAIAGVDLATDGRAILTATGNADITPEQAGRLLAGLGSLARVIETDELLKRIERLEASHAANPKQA
jgi:hypothetical protein